MNKGKEKVTEEHIAGIAFSLSSSTTSINNTWIIDTGATDHMCCDLDSMINIIDLYPPIIVKFPNNSTVLASKMGSVALTPALTLHKVLFVPSFSFSLLSISSLLNQSHYIVNFSHNKCFIQDPHLKTVLALGETNGGLYQFKRIQSPPVPFCNASSATSNLWHIRLGHTPMHVIKNIVPLVAHSKLDCHSTCSVCPMAKQCKLPFPVSVSQTVCAFELLHLDV